MAARLQRSLACATLLALLGGATSIAPQDKVGPDKALPGMALPGERVPDFEFRVLLGGDGRTKLSEFRGQPLMIVYYSDVGAGMNAAHATEKLEEKYAGDGFVRILMEIKNKGPVHMQALVLNELPGSTCRLLKLQTFPFDFDKQGVPPRVALIGVDGTLLDSGSYDFLSRMEKLLKADLKQVTRGWGDHVIAKKARALAYGKGDLAGGHRMVADALAAAPDEEDLAEAQAELATRFDTWKRSVGHLLAQGEPRRAIEAAEALAASVRADEAWSREVTELLASLETDDVARELALAKELDRLLGPLRSGKVDERQAEKLRKFAEEAQDSAVAARAMQIAEAVDYAVSKL